MSILHFKKALSLYYPDDVSFDFDDWRDIAVSAAIGGGVLSDHTRPYCPIYTSDQKSLFGTLMRDEPLRSAKYYTSSITPPFEDLSVLDRTRGEIMLEMAQRMVGIDPDHAIIFTKGQMEHASFKSINISKPTVHKMNLFMVKDSDILRDAVIKKILFDTKPPYIRAVSRMSSRMINIFKYIVTI